MADRPHSVMQEWTHRLSMMQQTVLMTAIRGPDGLHKYHPSKWILRWYRRGILYSAIDKRIINNPWWQGGGSFTGQSVVTGRYSEDVGPDDIDVYWEGPMEKRVEDYIRSLDEVPSHFQLHLMHAAEILGYKHPIPRIRKWWHGFYERLVHDMHLFPETCEQMDKRLGDNREDWLARSDAATRE